MSIKVLASGDLHMGRRPSKVPEPGDRSRFSCTRMWKSIVDRAIEEQVDLVALSGDVVDNNNRFFEAVGPLEEGLRRLVEAGISTYAVAGNHDYDVLPRIFDALSSDLMHLLGRGGCWEEVLFESRDGSKLWLQGWSFPKRSVSVSPLSDYHLSTHADQPTLGLLHADMDDPASKYAPVSRTELQSRDLTLWLLGHIHRPQYYEGAGLTPLLYPGSPQAMDPGEPGRHGPWLLEIHGPHQIDARQLPLSKVRYDILEIDLGEVTTRDQFEATVDDTIRQYLVSLTHEESPLELASLRLVLNGRTALCGQIRQLIQPLTEEYQRSVDGVTASLDKVINNTRPVIDLAELAHNHDPPGVLAQLLLDLQSENSEDALRELLGEAQGRLREVYDAPAYATLADGSRPGVHLAKEMLVGQASLLLETLRAQERSP